MANGRREARIVVNREFASIDDFVTEYVTNISRTGAFIRTENPMPVGTKVLLEFSIIADELEIVKGEGEVVRTVLPGSTVLPEGAVPPEGTVLPGGAVPPEGTVLPEGNAVAGMGVVFVRLTTVSKRFLEALLSRRAPPPRPKARKG